MIKEPIKSYLLMNLENIEKWGKIPKLFKNSNYYDLICHKSQNNINTCCYNPIFYILKHVFSTDLDNSTSLFFSLFSPPTRSVMLSHTSYSSSPPFSDALARIGQFLITVSNNLHEPHYV